MNLVRWSPIGDIFMLQNRMNRLFEDALHSWPSASDGTTSWVPAADIYETESELVLQADLPGVDPKQIDVRVENNVLTIRGERAFESKVDRENFHRVERSYGTFMRSFTLATPVDADKIKATCKNGVLQITLPKAEQAKPKKIQIAAAGA